LGRGRILRPQKETSELYSKKGNFCKVVDYQITEAVQTLSDMVGNSAPASRDFCDFSSAFPHLVFTTIPPGTAL
jgi:hypothetical protein